MRRCGTLQRVLLPLLPKLATTFFALATRTWRTAECWYRVARLGLFFMECRTPRSLIRPRILGRAYPTCNFLAGTRRTRPWPMGTCWSRRDRWTRREELTVCRKYGRPRRQPGRI